MPCSPARCADCGVRGTGLCAAFADADLPLLHAIGRRRSIAAGQVLVWAGDPVAICAVLVGGVLKVVRDGPDGRDHIVGLLFPGDFVGEMFAEQAHESIAVLADAELCVYPRPMLEHLLEEHPAAARALLQRALATLNAARHGMLTLGRRQAAEKVAGFLVDMAARTRREGAPADIIELPMGRAAIGEALGLTIETVSRQMSALKQARLIALPGGRIVQLLDPAGLRNLAG